MTKKDKQTKEMLESSSSKKKKKSPMTKHMVPYSQESASSGSQKQTPKKLSKEKKVDETEKKRDLKRKGKEIAADVKKKKAKNSPTTADKKNVAEVVKQVLMVMDQQKKGKRKSKEAAEEDSFQVLRIKNTPKPLHDAIKTLSESQKECLKDHGFGNALKNKLDTLPGKLPYFVLQNFDEKKMRINLNNGEFIPITADQIHDMLGIPNKGVKITSLEYHDDVKENWKLNYENEKKKVVITATAVRDRIIEERLPTWDFLIDFLVLFVNTMGLTDKMGNLDTSVVGYLKLGVDIKNINWCDYILELVKTGKSKWNDKESEFYSGPITLLMLLYLDNTIVRGMDVPRRRPALGSWNFSLIKKRQELEMKNGVFGKVSKNRYVREEDMEDGSESESDEKREKPIKQDKRDQKIYKERLKMYLDDPTNEKDCLLYLEEMHETINDQKRIVTFMLGNYLKFFPESESLKKWKETFIKLYGEDFQIPEASSGEKSTPAEDANEEEIVEDQDEDDVEIPEASIEKSKASEEGIGNDEAEERKENENVEDEQAGNVQDENEGDKDDGKDDGRNDGGNDGGNDDGNDGKDDGGDDGNDGKDDGGNDGNDGKNTGEDGKNKGEKEGESASKFPESSKQNTGEDGKNKEDEVVKEVLADIASKFPESNSDIQNENDPRNLSPQKLNDSKEVSSAQKETAGDQIQGTNDEKMDTVETLITDIVPAENKEEMTSEVKLNPNSEIIASTSGPRKKRLVISHPYTSPYENKIVEPWAEYTNEEISVAEEVFSLRNGANDIIFEPPMGADHVRGTFESMSPKTCILNGAIDCMAAVLNYENGQQEENAIRRFFFPTVIWLDDIMDDTYKEKEDTFENFQKRMGDYMQNDKQLLSMKDMDLVFFPIVHSEHYYLVVFNLKNVSVNIIDNSAVDVPIEAKYGNKVKTLHSMFVRHLEDVNHKKAAFLKKQKLKRTNMIWRTVDNHIDCAVFVMRHMETYFGGPVKNWESGLDIGGSETQKKALRRLRFKYISKILLSPVNKQRLHVTKEARKFARLEYDERKRIVAEAQKEKLQDRIQWLQ